MPRWRRFAGKALLFLLWVGTGMLIWLMGKERPDPLQGPPPPLETAILLSLALGLFMTFGAPWLYWLIPIEVRLADRGVMTLIDGQWRSLKYRRILRARIATRTCAEGTFAVLVLERRKGEPLLLGIDPAVDLGEVKRILHERGVALDRSVDGL
jgi:hypothetical protein